MTRIEDELHAAAAELRDATSQVDVEAALGRALAPESTRRRAPLLAGVAAAVVVALVASVALWWPARETGVVADRSDESPSTLPASTAVRNDVAPTTTAPAATGSSAPGPGDLLAPEPGREITFEGIGDVMVGQTLAPEWVTTDFPGSECGYWPDGEVVQSADAPPTALVGATNTPQPRVVAVYLRNNSTYRTASGIGIGTSLASLERIYGDRLVVDEADGWEQPTDGLLASYQSVAAVQDGGRAITYTLTDTTDPTTATVEAVKVSAADFWGDDEGCA